MNHEKAPILPQRSQRVWKILRDKGAGAAYNEKADKRSWQAMKDFFDEIFK
jgi:dienelactone hydrolase